MIASAIAFTTTADAAPIVLQPAVETAKDTFAYRVLGDMTFDSGGWQRMIATGKTASAHDLEGFIRFDLSGLSLDEGETATLNLYVADTVAAGFGKSPSEAAPVVTQLFSAASAWEPGTTTWNNKPGKQALIGSNTLTGIGNWVQFDVTEQLRAWLAEPSTHYGFVLAQESAVTHGGPVMGVFDASGGSNRPYLEIVPEPTLSTAALAALLLMARRNRR